jgi:pimeloyl-ACP methyl ester carboxylesterase
VNSRADRSLDQPDVSTYVDREGREHHYILVEHENARTLVIHFSAFYGDWGNLKPYRHNFQGYFHRFRMFADVTEHNWLFLCDEYGAENNGTYYAGHRGDLFVERAVDQILDSVIRDHSWSDADVVMIGSSMGATAALKFGLMRDVRGIVAIAPHVDLDICAERQNRMPHVAFICPDGNALAEHNYKYTRHIRQLIASRAEQGCPPPRLFVQACADDDGVFPEQIEPLLAGWRAAGGSVEADIRPTGGHTSDWAPRALLLDVINRLLNDDEIPLALYQTTLPYLGRLTPEPSRLQVLMFRVRRRSRRFLGRS